MFVPRILRLQVLRLAVIALCGAAAPVEGVEQYRIGGATGIAWEDIGQLNGLTTATATGDLRPAGVNPARDALSDLSRLGGTIKSPQASRENLTLLLTDNNEETLWRVTRDRRPDGTSMVIDLGAVLPINRMSFLGVSDSFLRAYELFVHDGNPNELRNGVPIAYVNQVASNLEQDDPVIEVEIPLQFVRFIRLISRTTQEFTITEAQVFGDGFAPAGDFVSHIIDLEVPANIGRILLTTQTDESTSVILQTRSGSVPDPFLYYRKTEVIQGEDRAEEVIIPVGSPEAKAEYDALFSADKGDPRDNIDEWSPWSAPYEDLAGEFLSPGNRQYVQFRLFFSSEDARQGAAVEAFEFEYSAPTLAADVIGEVWPAEVTLGEVESFDYYIASTFGADNPGFDRIEIRTPFPSEILDVWLNGVIIPYEELERGDGTQLTLQLTQDRVETSGDVVRIGFEALVTVYGTTFFGKVFDTTIDELGQNVVAGDADVLIASDRLSVQGRLRSELIVDLERSPGVFSPNGDGINDELRVSYILLRALAAVPVELTIHDLSGRRIRVVEKSGQLNGPQVILWDGRDEGGELVPPGVYLVRLSIDTDTGTEERSLAVGVAY
jgi:hypothetical protein